MNQRKVKALRRVYHQTNASINPEEERVTNVRLRQFEHPVLHTVFNYATATFHNPPMRAWRSMKRHALS